MAYLIFRVQHVIKTEIDVTQAQLARNGVETLWGSASFVDPNTIRVENSRNTMDYRADNVVIATGTKPAGSAKVPFNGRNIINSDQVLDLKDVPRSFIVVGGGVIGV
jgi:NAD(P) transhydrogenase